MHSKIKTPRTALSQLRAASFGLRRVLWRCSRPMAVAAVIAAPFRRGGISAARVFVEKRLPVDIWIGVIHAIGCDRLAIF